MEYSNVTHSSAVSGQVVRGGAVLRQLRVVSWPLLGGAVHPPRRPAQHPAGMAAGAVSKQMPLADWNGNHLPLTDHCLVLSQHKTAHCRDSELNHELIRIKLISASVMS